MAAHGTTMALFLSVRRPRELQADLIDGGYAPDTPAAVVYKASWPDEIVFRCRWTSSATRIREAKITTQALVLVGPALGGGAGAGQSHVYDPRLRPPLPAASARRAVQEACLRSTSSASPAAPCRPGPSRCSRRRASSPAAARCWSSSRPASEHVVLGKDLDATLRDARRGRRRRRARVGRPGLLRHRPRALRAGRTTRRAPRAVVRRARVRAARRSRGTTRSSSPPTAATRAPAINAALRHPKVAILTEPGNAELIVEALDGPPRRRSLEALGTPDERLATEPPFADPNVVIVHEPTAGRATVWPPRTPTRWALPEDAFEHRAGMITKAEVRALALAALGPGTGDLDLGRRLRQRRGRRSSARASARPSSRSTSDPDAIALDRRATRPRTACPLAHRARRRARGAARSPRARRRLRRRRRRDLPPSSTRRRRARRRAVVVTLALIDRIAPDDRAPRRTRLRRHRDDAAGEPPEAARGRPPPRRREPRDRDRGGRAG